MCQILIATADQLLAEQEQLKQEAAANPHGIGFAFQSAGSVHFIKDLDLVQTISILNQLEPETRVIVHFRLASVGKVAAELTHPFPLNLNQLDQLQGEAAAVLFHNGTVSNWDNLLFTHADLSTLPAGNWSDTRALAYLAAAKGTAIINLVSQVNRSRFAIMRADSIDLFGSFEETRGIMHSSPLKSNCNRLDDRLFASFAKLPAATSPIMRADDLQPDDLDNDDLDPWDYWEDEADQWEDDRDPDHLSDHELFEYLADTRAKVITSFKPAGNE